MHAPSLHSAAHNQPVCCIVSIATRKGVCCIDTITTRKGVTIATRKGVLRGLRKSRGGGRQLDLRRDFGNGPK